MLKTRQLDSATVTKGLDTIERNVKLQIQLIDDLLDVSRILRGKLNLEMSSVDLPTVIQASVETINLAAAAKSIQINTQLDFSVGLISGDFNRLQQVVGNLLSNAVKFTPIGGRVEVILSRVCSHAEIKVKDTGKGIDPEFLPHVFEYFRQADSSTTRYFGGLGLGLAIVKHLVELHGGTVTAESPGEEQGATFTIRLPLMHPPLLLFQEDAIPQTTPNLGGVKILIVDDDSDTREFISFLLEDCGASVTVAASANEALCLLAQSLPNILISDLGMPFMDGYGLIRQIRKMPADQGGQIPAIALTAYAADSDRQQVLAAGYNKHIAKPVDPNELVLLIAELNRRGGFNEEHVVSLKINVNPPCPHE